MGLDIGPKTVKLYCRRNRQRVHHRLEWADGRLRDASHSRRARAKIAQAIAKNEDATSIVGGGDSVAAVHQAGVADKITHISTGGGASLEFLEGKKLPGVEALNDK